MTQHQDLQRAKNQALVLLLLVSATFVLMVFLPRGIWTDGIKAVAEAAMVGALADWFAVTALFRRIPIPFISRHTNIIPNSKDQIANNLATFVQDKFLNAEAIVGLIKNSNPAEKISLWLQLPANTEQLGRYALKWLEGVLQLTDDTQIRAFIRKAIHTLLGKVDLSQSMGLILDNLTRDGRHQKLLDQALDQLLQLLKNDETRSFISGQILKWMKSRYSMMEKVLPTGWIAENGAELIEQALENLLIEVNNDPGHELRASFDHSVRDFVESLKTDPAYLAKGEAIKHYLQNDPTLNTYVGDLWTDLRDWLLQDLRQPESVIHCQVVKSGAWIGTALSQDVALRQSLNQHLEALAREMAPGLSDYVSNHIRQTIRNWDAKEMSAQIEVSIGKDLQYIRINGTLVGGAIGLLLYLFSKLPAAHQWLTGQQG